MKLDAVAITCCAIFFTLHQNENCRCIDIFNPQEQKILLKYRKEHFADKILIPGERRLIGKCPLTPEEVLNLLVDFFIPLALKE
jgi:hypothetical protein